MGWCIVYQKANNAIITNMFSEHSKVRSFLRDDILQVSNRNIYSNELMSSNLWIYRFYFYKKTFGSNQLTQKIKNYVCTTV